MKIFITLLITFSFVFSSDSMEDLLKNIKQSSITWQNIDNERLERFLADKKQKEKLLKDIKKELKKEQSKTKKLQNTITKNEDRLQELENKLKIKSGNLGEMFGVVRQISGDFKSNIYLSNTSATLQNREAFLEKLAKSKELPKIDDLEKLWYMMSEDTIKSGKVEKNTLEIISKDGAIRKQDVINVGEFIAISNGEFLNYIPSEKKFSEIPGEVSYSLSSNVKDFESTSGLVNVVVDPTKGSLLALINERPTISERIEQGGVVGYIIIALGLFGLVVAIVKFVSLYVTSLSVDKQLKNLDEISDKNPLGRVINSFNDFKLDLKEKDLTLFEAKLDEIVLKEIYKIKKYENIIKLIATVAPLLGLLGTVTGMIETFGAITIFGTSDPKLMAGGISQALVTTVLGLCVAIPMLFLHSLVSSRSNKIVGIIDEQSAALIVKSGR